MRARHARRLFAGWMTLSLISSCGPSVEDTLQNDNFVRWSRDQQITYDLFEGEGPPNGYSAWIGVYFISDLTKLPDQLYFNVTIFLDKKKSFASKVDENSDPMKHMLFPTL